MTELSGSLSLGALNLRQNYRLAAKWLVDPLFWLILLFAVVLFFAPLLATHSPVEPNLKEKLQPPSAQHFFGTDSYGMDVYSRVLYATRIDFSAALIAVFLGVAVGVPLGSISGYVGGVLDDILSRLVEIMQAFPRLLFAMAVLALLGSTVTNLVLVIALFVAPAYLKLVRSIAVSFKNADFIQAARCAGASTLTIVFRHILRNAVSPFFGQFAISCAHAIQTIAGLSFLGLGVQVPQPEWGSMIQMGSPYIIFGMWWPSLFPGVAIFLAVLMMRLISGRIRTRYMREV